MYYKTKKISNISSVLQVSLFRHYRKVLAPLNPLNNSFQNWLTMVSCLILGYALLQSTFVIFGISLVWLLYPTSKAFLWYTPISLTFWILFISFCTTLHSLKICFSLPKEFRLLLLIEQGLSLKTFMGKSSTTQKKIGLLLLLFLFLFYWFPKILIAIVWGIPLISEFYCLSGLTNSYLTKNLYSTPNQTFSTMLGFEYNYLMSPQTNSKGTNTFLFDPEFYDDWIDEDYEVFATGEEGADEMLEIEEMEEFNTDFDFDFDDLEDSPWSVDDLLYQRRIPKNVAVNLKEPKFKLNYLLTSAATDNSADLRTNFPEFYELQDISLDLKYQYKKVPSLYRYLKFQKEIPKKKETFLSEYTSIETRLWTKMHLNIDSLKLPNSSPWHNTSIPLFFDNLFSKYEELSEYYNEVEADNNDGDLFDDPQFELFEDELNEYELFGPDPEFLSEPGAGNEYKAPNWFWISFFYYSLGFWFILNAFLFLFFLFCGIPENWLLSMRATAGQNVLLYKTLLTMTEQLYTKWGFTKLPVGSHLRIDYFNYMQPSYFRRIPKLYKRLSSVTHGNKLHPWGWWYWGRTYKHWRLFGIAQGPSIFHKNPKYADFYSFLYRKRSSILINHRMQLSQDVGQFYLNSLFFEKKEQQVLDFYQFLDKKNIK
jgi:hypothetical protein